MEAFDRWIALPPMPSPPKKRLPLQRIAADVLRNASRGFLDPQDHPDWVASIMRQWASYDGHAAVFTSTDKFWLKLTRKAEGYNVKVQHNAGCAITPFLADWNCDPAMVPRLITSLNLLQVVEFENREGRRLRLRVEPHERRVSLEQVEDDGNVESR
jgi:hypothetical protein